MPLSNSLPYSPPSASQFPSRDSSPLLHLVTEAIGDLGIPQVEENLIPWLKYHISARLELYRMARRIADFEGSAADLRTRVEGLLSEISQISETGIDNGDGEALRAEAIRNLGAVTGRIVSSTSKGFLVKIDNRKQFVLLEGEERHETNEAVVVILRNMKDDTGRHYLCRLVSGEEIAGRMKFLARKKEKGEKAQE